MTRSWIDIGGVIQEEGARNWIDIGGVIQETQSGATVRALVLDSGYIEQYTSGGARLRLDGGLLSTSSGGTAIVWDATLKMLREATSGETVLAP